MKEKHSTLLDPNDIFYAMNYLSTYNFTMQMIESLAYLPESHVSKLEQLSQRYDVICERCKADGVSIHDVQWDKKVKTYINCIETFDRTVKCKLVKNYHKRCEIALAEYNKKVKRYVGRNRGNLLKCSYSSWLANHSGIIKTTKLLLNDVVETDPEEVKEVVPFARKFQEFLDVAAKEINDTIRAIKEKQAEREKAYEEALEKVRREREEKQAQEAARIAAEQAAKEVAERAERERLAMIERRRQEYVAVINEIMPVEGKQLDTQQIDCILDDSHSTLVIAGAGSGKTTTIIGKVKYLLHTNQCKPEEILLLSFTHKSAEEMKMRIKAETGIDMDVFTFHKLGMEIITGVEKKKPTIYSKSLQYYAKEGLNKYLSNSYYRRELLNYCFLKPSRARSVFDYQSREEMFEYNGTSPTVTINKEYVKSVCELEIANFLCRNQIRYTYEKPYKYNTANEQYSGYKPDFYLEDYDIYIEFYAVNKNGDVPEWFEGRDGKTARTVYHEGIAWKRRLHKQHGTTLVEVSYADKQDNCLLDILQSKLEELGVKFCPLDDEQLFSMAKKNNSYTVSNVAEIIGSVISLVKANGYTYDFFEKINKNPKNDSIIKLAKPIARDYEQMLRETEQIDFNDMIYKACKYFKYGRASHDYKFVIVDEYQDISKARCSLLKEMRKQHDYSLFCVGDDWQSIYRFAGSDIGYILDFDEYWGDTTRYKIETTYRFPNEILSKSGGFIMRNPSQIKKELKTSNEEQGEIGFICESSEKLLLEKMTEKLVMLPNNSTVFLIGRYTADKDILKCKDTPYSVCYDNVQGKYAVLLENRPDLKIEFLTAHKSKGLQADYVFIINNKRKGMGFPSRIHNDPVINFLLRKSDNYPYSEERRLFYVALTRAKRRVWLLIENGNSSIFADEIRGITRSMFGFVKKRRYW